VESSRTLVQPARRRAPAPESGPAPEPGSAPEPPPGRIAGPGRTAPADAEPARDQLLLGRYRVIERLGAGGFGVVWRAHDQLLGREVALKRVWLGTGGRPVDGERASREAHAAARLAHPAIVSLHEAVAEDGAFYLISELVAGETLAALIEQDALCDEEILEIGVALAAALAHAHARGVIHRDIKPSNVLVPNPPDRRADGAHGLLAPAKLTDFGGASLVGEEALTRTGDVLGTLAYMAPEQSEGREVGTQADLYSLALVIYEALCGVNPVRGSTPAATVRRIGRTVPALSLARGDLPASLTGALDRALDPDPERRGTLQELRGELEDALARGLRRPRWRLRAAGRDSARAHTEPTQLARAPAAPAWEAGAMLPRAPAAPASPAGAGALADDEQAPVERRGPGPALALPRRLWIAAALALALWQAISGHAGVGLLALAALAPALALGDGGPRRRLGVGWLCCALAPALGLAGLAGAYPALAGQPARWRARALLGALGYWWLALAAPLLGRELWLAPPSPLPARASWEGSASVAATHVIGPLLTVAVLAGALLWAAAAAALPWLVRGRSALRDAVAVAAWAAALVLAEPALDAGLGAQSTSAAPRGAALGAVLGALLALAARALRGPV